MSVMMASRCKLELIGKLAEAPVFSKTSSGATFARIKIETVERFMIRGERRSETIVHDVIVYNTTSVALLEKFSTPGLHFIVVGTLTAKREIEVRQYGGECSLMYTGETGEAEQKPAAQAQAAVTTQPKAATATSAPAPSRGPAPGSKPSGGIGRFPAKPAQAKVDDDYDNGPSESRLSRELDDDIPF